MKPAYLVGCGISVAVSIATLAIKAAFTKYLGAGDFMLIVLSGALLGEHGRRLLPYDAFFIYLPKAIFAVGLFSFFYAPSKKLGGFRLPCSIILTLSVLVIMSLGEAVVG